MDYRQLGRSGLRVSALALGSMTFGGRGNFAKTGATDLSGARRLIDRALDAGVTLIDTADIYSQGLSEEIVGEALEGRPARGMLIATKARFPHGAGPNSTGLSRPSTSSSLPGQLCAVTPSLIHLHHFIMDGRCPSRRRCGVYHLQCCRVDWAPPPFGCRPHQSAVCENTVTGLPRSPARIA